MILFKHKESWLRGIHPQPLCPYAKTKIKFVNYRKVTRLIVGKRKVYIIQHSISGKSTININNVLFE